MNLIRNIHSRHINGAQGLDPRLADIKRKATKDIETSYFASKMTRTYDACKQEQGRGSSHRMAAHIEEALTNPLICPFAAVTSGLKKDFGATCDQLANGMYTELIALLEEMRLDLQGALGGIRMTGSEEKACKEIVLPLLEKNMERVAASKASLRDIKDKYDIKEDALIIKEKAIKEKVVKKKKEKAQQTGWFQNLGARLGF